MFRDVAPSADLTFVEYYFNYGLEAHPEYFAPYGALRFWHEFKDANALLDAVRPDRVVFLYISSLNQVALKVAAQARGIPTLHLEHGFRLRFSEPLHRTLLARQTGARFNLVKLRRELPHIVRNHAFFLRSVARTRAPVRRELLAYGFESYARGLSVDTRLRYGRLRQPDHYIAFSPEIFEFHREQDALTAQDMKKVTFIGLPQFDSLCNLPNETIDPHNVILIDNRNHEGNIFGWTLEFRREWVKKLNQTTQDLGLKLFVKEHPGDASKSWAPYVARGEVELIDHTRLRELLPKTRLILGGFSTMQLPLIVLPHTVFLALEIHPEKGHVASDQFVDAGVVSAVEDFEDLRAKLTDWKRLAAEQSQHKEAFTQRFLFKMDGKAGARLRDILVQGC
jgi:hypothetical protein